MIRWIAFGVVAKVEVELGSVEAGDLQVAKAAAAKVYGAGVTRVQSEISYRMSKEELAALAKGLAE